MQCPSCGALVATDERVCGHCGRDFRTPPRPLAPKPAKYRVVDDGFRLEISWSWFTPLVFGLLVFAIAWNSFLVGWYSMASGMPEDFGAMRWIFLIFPIGHVAVGLGLIYTVLTMFLNSTTISIDGGQLTVRHGPIYFPGGLTLDVADIDQFYVVQVSQPTKGDGTTLQATLRVRTRDNHSHDLICGLHDASEGVYLEQTLEKFLRITDVRVAGEVSQG